MQAALHVDVEGFAETVSAALVRMTGSAVFILSDEHGVVALFSLVVLTALIEQSRPDEEGKSPAYAA